MSRNFIFYAPRKKKPLIIKRLQNIKKIGKPAIPCASTLSENV